MEDCNNKGEVHAHLTKQKQSSSRSGISLKATLSGRLSPQHSPSFQRPYSTLTPRRESNRLLLWLLLITLWAYLGFCVQSRWAHDDKEGEFSGFGSRQGDTSTTNYYAAKNISLSANIELVENKTNDVPLANKEYEQYIVHFPAGASQVAWWIMENRQEYFDRAKDVLQRVNTLDFLSESQSRQCQKWCEEEGIKLSSQIAIVPLSVNDELAFVAGILSTLNAPSFSAAKMDERRKLLRDFVRREMALNDNDMLVMTLSSINRGKGQLLLLESARSIVKHGPLQDDHKKMQKSSDDVEHLSTLARRDHFRNLLKDISVALNNISSNFINSFMFTKQGKCCPRTIAQSLKILIGSVGSKSNKVDYVKGLLSFLARHSNLSTSVLWISATTCVASLYFAADVYVVNSQELAETFGRVTIEAMAFGLPVLGTDAGGTQEIVEHNVTGLLHPIGRAGNHVVAQNLRVLLENRLTREQRGWKEEKRCRGCS